MAPAQPGRPSDGGTTVAFLVLVLVLILIVATIRVVMRQLAPDPRVLFQGMFGYESDGWPRGVQEDDGERAWVPIPVPDWDPEQDELAWASTIGSSTFAEPDGMGPRERVPITRVKGDVSAAPRHRER